MLLVLLTNEKFLERLTKKEWQKTYQTESRVEKVIKKKGDKLYVKWKVMIIHLTVGLVKNLFINTMTYFSRATWLY